MGALYEEHSPPARLLPYVECFWRVTTAHALPDHPVLPDGCLDLVFSPDYGLRAVGAMTVTLRHALAPGQTFTGVRFRPGKAPCFLHTPAQDLTDRSVELEDLWGAAGRSLRQNLGEARSFHEQAGLLAGHLIASAEVTPSDRALDAITAADGNVDLELVARHANLSLRQFRRRCLALTGLSPKLLCRVLRFRGALRVARTGEFRTWADVAAECGYYDQAHLIRDFQEFTGSPPGMTVFSKTGAASSPYNRGVGRTTREAYARADVGRH